MFTSLEIRLEDKVGFRVRVGARVRARVS